MSTDKTSSDNNSQQILPRFPFKAIIRLYLLIICIIAIGSIYPLSKTLLFSSPSGRTRKPANINIDTINIDEITKLSIQLGKTNILADPYSEQIFPMVVSLEAQIIPSQRFLDLVFIIDQSESMKGEKKFDFAKFSLLYLLNFLDDKDRISIILSNDQASSTLLPFTNTTEENKKKIYSTLDPIKIQDGDRVNINKGLEASLEILGQRERINQGTAVFLLSDGLDQTENLHQEIQKTLKQFKSHKTPIYTFGYGKDHDPELLTNIANSTGGTFFPFGLANITEIIEKSLRVLQDSLVKNIELIIQAEHDYYRNGKLLNKIEIVKVYGDEAIWNKQWDKIYITSLPSLLPGQRKTFKFELKIPNFEGGLPYSPLEGTIASCKAILTLYNGSEIVKNAELKVKLVEEKDEGNNKEV